VVASAQTGQGRLDQSAIANAWFACFSKALSIGDYVSLSALLSDDCYWRDLLTFGWKLQTLQGIPQITSWLEKSFAIDPAVNLRLVGEVSEGSLGEREQAPMTSLKCRTSTAPMLRWFSARQ
jgi:hypothetical protein